MNRASTVLHSLDFDHEDNLSQLQLLFFEKGMSFKSKPVPPPDQSLSTETSADQKLILVLHGADPRFFMALKNFIANHKWREVSKDWDCMDSGTVLVKDSVGSSGHSHVLSKPTNAQLSPSAFLQPTHWLLMNVNKEIELQLEVEGFGLQNLASNMGMCAMQLHRKLKKVAGLSPAIYIRTYRLHRSLDFLKDKRFNITQVAFRVGFRSLEYFSRSFKQEFGTSPSTFRATCWNSSNEC